MSLKAKPSYILHRTREAVDAALATMITSLGLIKDKKVRGDINSWGFKTIEGFVQLVAGTTPTVDLEILEVIQWPDPTDSDIINEELVASTQANITGLSDKEKFTITIPEGGRIYLRIAAVTGAPTGIHIFVTGGEPSPSLLEQRRQS